MVPKRPDPNLGWHFPPTNGGRIDGFNDPGIAHFSGSPLRSLARETVQNSMDARISKTRPVTVSFELREVNCRDDFSLEELASHIRACLVSARGDAKATSVLENALATLESGSGTLQFLRVSDQQTTGLLEKNWRALVKMQGTSIKSDSGAGGSFGIGKYAPFSVSPLRTVCYWTFVDEGSKVVEKFQGKAVLMSHTFGDGEVGETQGTGFFGEVNGCRELTGGDIPEAFRLLDHKGRPIQGTAVWIAGFPTREYSQREIAQSILESFFCAIDNDDLVVIVEPDDSSPEPRLEISKSTLADWFEYLLGAIDGDKAGAADRLRGVREAKLFREIMRGDSSRFVLSDPDFGECTLWIRVGDDLPSKVALVRATGMLITTQQPSLIRFRGLREFVAVCMFDDPAGNEWLRQMENPQHDRFEPDRLPDDRRNRGRRALNRVTNWIREKIKDQATPVKEEAPEELIELAALLPDYDSSGAFRADTDGPEPAKSFGVGGQIRHKPPRKRVKPPPVHKEVDQLQEGEDGDGDESGNVGGEGENGNGKRRRRVGPNDGEGSGGTGSRGGKHGLEAVPLDDVRVIRSTTNEETIYISFTPRRTGTVRIELAEAGDSIAFPRADLSVFDMDGEPLSIDSVSIEEGKRRTLQIKGQFTVRVAWQVVALAEVDR